MKEFDVILAWNKLQQWLNDPLGASREAFLFGHLGRLVCRLHWLNLKTCERETAIAWGNTLHEAATWALQQFERRA